jgi:hypothetical protein
MLLEKREYTDSSARLRYNVSFTLEASVVSNSALCRGVSSNPNVPRSHYDYLGLEVGYFLIELLESISLSSSTFFYLMTLGGGILRLEPFNLGLELDNLLLFLYEFHHETMNLASSTLTDSFLRSGGDA